MKRPGSKKTADEKAAGASADKAESAASSSNSEASSETPGNTNAAPRPWPNTAIERQIAKVSARRSHKRAHQEAVSHISARRKTNSHTRRRKPHRVGLASFLVFFLFVAAGLAWVFTDPERPMQKAISTVWQRVWPTAVTPNPAPVGAAQAPVPKVAEVATPAEVAIPIADVSLRNRPELLTQLVQVYRSRLAVDPSDSAALTALNQLQERSLSELETMIVEGGDNATAAKSLQDISRLFPELADNPRYKYLNSRIYLQVADKPADKPAPSTPLAATISQDKTISPDKTTAPDKTTSSSAKNISPEKTISSPAKPIAPEKAVPPEQIVSEQTVSSPLESAATAPKKTDKKIALSSKPEIRAVSITPGRMVEDQFIPGDGGNVLMVAINYRNFEKIADDQSDVTLVTRLGIPGDSTVLAEVPVVVSGDRGSTSFLIETLMPGNSGEKYQLNFLVNGEFLTSRVIRLSRPGQ